MATAVEDVFELSPPARRILADMEVRGRGCISIRGPQSWKWFFAALKASGGYVWSDVVPTSCSSPDSRHKTGRSILYWLQPFCLNVSYCCQQSIAIVQPTVYKRLYQWPQIKRLLSEIIWRNDG